MPVVLDVNGRRSEVAADPETPLLYVLRNDLKLKGARYGCGIGACGACMVIVDGKPVQSCDVPVSAMAGKKITTIEGIGTPDNLHPIQQAFIDCGGFQCGICTPGQIVATKALLDENPKPTEDEIKEWLMGNLCRCTGYYQIIDSVKQASGQPVAPTPGA